MKGKGASGSFRGNGSLSGWRHELAAAGVARVEADEPWQGMIFDCCRQEKQFFKH
jgi:hypothetical protein